ncbi:Protein of unknown function [Gryllus bimaculatus]|nr:Protein of unknown function [Gryllus bimaculatus]
MLLSPVPQKALSVSVDSGFDVLSTSHGVLSVGRQLQSSSLQDFFCDDFGCDVAVAMGLWITEWTCPVKG